MESISVPCVMGMTLCAHCQLTGEATVLSYAPMMFRQIGFHSDTAAVLATLGLGVVKVTAAVAHLSRHSEIIITVIISYNLL